MPEQWLVQWRNGGGDRRGGAPPAQAAAMLLTSPPFSSLCRAAMPKSPTKGKENLAWSRAKSKAPPGVPPKPKRGSKGVARPRESVSLLDHAWFGADKVPGGEERITAIGPVQLQVVEYRQQGSQYALKGGSKLFALCEACTDTGERCSEEGTVGVSSRLLWGSKCMRWRELWVGACAGEHSFFVARDARQQLNSPHLCLPNSHPCLPSAALIPALQVQSFLKKTDKPARIVCKPHKKIDMGSFVGKACAAASHSLRLRRRPSLESLAIFATPLPPLVQPWIARRGCGT